MNVLEQELEEEGYAVIAEIARICIELNQKTDLAVWFGLIGHVDWIEVKIAKSREDYNNALARGVRYTPQSSMFDEGELNSLRRMRDRLERILEKGGVERSDLEQTTVERISVEYLL